MLKKQVGAAKLIYMYIIYRRMARTIMIANDVYDQLKRMKENESFTELIKTLMHERMAKKTGKELFKFFGALDGDQEYPLIMKELRKKWATWTAKYA